MALGLIIDNVNLILVSASASFYSLNISILHPLNSYYLSILYFVSLFVFHLPLSPHFYPSVVIESLD